MVIAHDVDPIELVVWLPALCRKMGVPYAIVKGKSRLGQIVHSRTATALALTSVKNEDKHDFSKIVEAVKVSSSPQLELNFFALYSPSLLIMPMAHSYRAASCFSLKILLSSVLVQRWLTFIYGFNCRPTSMTGLMSTASNGVEESWESSRRRRPRPESEFLRRRLRRGPRRLVVRSLMLICMSSECLPCLAEIISIVQWIFGFSGSPERICSLAVSCLCVCVYMACRCPEHLGVSAAVL